LHKLSTFFETKHQPENREHYEDDRPAGGEIKIKRGDDAGNDGEKGNAFGDYYGATEILFVLECCDDWNDDERGNEENADNRNGKGNHECGEKNKQQIDEFCRNSRNAR